MITDPVAAEWWLNADIISITNPSCIYGCQGDKVTVISDHGDVWIVEGENKERFPAKRTWLSSTVVTKKDAVGAAKTESSSSRRGGSKKKGSSGPVIQNTMF